MIDQAWVAIVAAALGAAIPVLIGAWSKRSRGRSAVDQAGTVTDKALSLLDASEEYHAERAEKDAEFIRLCEDRALKAEAELVKVKRELLTLRREVSGTVMNHVTEERE